MRNEQVLCSRAVHCCGQDPAAKCQLAATEMDKRWRYCRNKKCSTTIRDTSSSGAPTLTTRAAPWASIGQHLEVSTGLQALCIPFPVPGVSEERGLATALTSVDTLCSRDLREVGWVGIMYVMVALRVHFVYSAAEFGWIFNLHQSLDREWDLRADSIECRIYNQMAFVLELQHLIKHLVPDQGDWHSEPGGGRGGREVQDGGARGLITLTLTVTR